MRKTLRQEGLIDQRSLEELRISIVDDGESQDIREEAILIAKQLGFTEGQITSKNDDSDFEIHLGNSIPDEGSEVPYCRVQLIDDGFRVTNRRDTVSGNPSSLQRPGFRTIACSVAWQEVIRMTGIMLPVEIPKKFLEVCLRVDTNSIPNGTKIEDFIEIIQADSSSVPFQVIPRTQDGRGHVLLKIRAEEGNELADLLFSNLQICRQQEKSLEACDLELRLPRVEGPASGSATFPGLGGLGSWTLHTIIGGLRESDSTGEGISLNLIDPDTEIEQHNLNRQVLYSEGDVGQEKALVAERELSERLPSAEISSFVGSVGLSHLFGLDHLGVEQNLCFDEEEDGIFSNKGGPNSQQSRAITGSDILICGVDNLRDRTILNAISSKLDIPMVNAGAQGFSGQFDLFMPDESCMLCRYGIGAVKEGVRMSCQEDGDVPFSSIVTSTAIFGALEGLALLAFLSGGQESLFEWPTHISWNGRSNSFEIRMGDAGLFREAFSVEGPHSAHLFNRLMDTGQRSHQ